MEFEIQKDKGKSSKHLNISGAGKQSGGGVHLADRHMKRRRGLGSPTSDLTYSSWWERGKHLTCFALERFCTRKGKEFTHPIQC